MTPPIPDPTVDNDIVQDQNPDTKVVPVPIETIQEVREMVSDLFYKLWFVKYPLTDEQILSMQTTIRDGNEQTGRTEDEPLVFYKKDRNTLENIEDLQDSQSDDFKLICQNIFDNDITDKETIEGMFNIIEPDEEPYSDGNTLPPNQFLRLKKYIMHYNGITTSVDIVIAEEVIRYEAIIPDDDIIVEDETEEDDIIVKDETEETTG